MGKNDSLSPDSIRTVKLLKFLLCGRMAEIDGEWYYLKAVAKSGDGAFMGKGTAVDDYSLEALGELADRMESKTYIDVMNFKAEKE